MRKRVRVSDGSYAYVTHRKPARRSLVDVVWEGYDRFMCFMDRMRVEHEAAMGVLTALIIGGLILLAGLIEGSDWPC